jgi:O-antigen/teichoic acid export membrane protein
MTETAAPDNRLAATLANEAGRSSMWAVWLQIIHTSGARIYSLIAGLAILTITARWLGPAGRGQMAAALVWANVFFMSSYSSLNYVVIHRASASAGERSWLPSALGTLLGFAGLMSVVCWLIAGILWFTTRGRLFGAIHPAVLVIAMLTVPFLIFEQYMNALLISIARLDVYNRAVIAAKTLVLLLIAVFFLCRFGLPTAVAATLAGQAGLSLAGLPLAFREAGHRMRFDPKLLRAMLSRGLRLHPSNAAMYVYSSSSVLLINRYLGTSATGVYYLANQLVDVMLVVPFAANLVLYEKTSAMGVAKVWPHQRRILLSLPLLMAAACAAAAMLAPFLIPLLAGKAFAPSVAIFRSLLVLVCVGTVNAVMMPQWISRGLFGAISIINVTAAAINLTAGFLLIKTMGIQGVIIATILGYSTTCVASLVLAVRCEIEYRRTRIA